MRTIIAISLLILLVAVACGTEAPEPTATTESMATGAATPTPTATAQDPDRAALLKDFAQLGGDAMAKREWAFVHALYPDEFKAKCSLGDFAGLMTFAWAFSGIPEGVAYVVEGVTVDGDQGRVQAYLEKDGVQIELDDDGDEEPDFIWRDGKWTLYVSPEELAEEDPCSLDFTAEDTPTRPITPTPTPTLDEVTNTPTPMATPGPTAMPTPTATPETISISEAIAQGYTREEEACSNRQQFPDLYSNVPHEELENGMCAFYYPPDDMSTTTSTPTSTSLTTWRGLVLAPEDRCSSYDPDDYPYSQSVEAQIVAAIGGIYGPYTGRWFASQKDTDIEHIVARSEAHDSGLCAANDAMRREFAADLLNLTLADPSVNRHQKSGKDAAEWLPDMNTCWFADRVIKVRLKYELTVDQAEADALGLVLTGCSSVEMVVVSATESVTPTPTPTPGADVDALALWDDNGNGRITCAEAERHGIAPVRRGHPAYQYMRDADDDGIVCE